MTNYFKRQFEYSQAMNQVFIDAFTRQMPPSEAIRLLSHVFNAHFIWLYHLGQGDEPPGVWDIHLPATLNVFNKEVHQLTANILARSGWENETVSYQTAKGGTYSNQVIDVLFHIINHSTHHRSQISFLLRRHEIEPPRTDFIFWLRQ